MNLPSSIAREVHQATDVDRVTTTARRFALDIGFSAPESEQVALATAELASNLVRHAGGGSMKLSLLVSAERRGIQIESEDHGPGIANVELALTDGYSTAGGLGHGLGTVNRMVDELEFHQRPVSGLRILCQRWVRPPTSRVTARRLECGAATRACRRAPENGDAIVIQQWEDTALLGVIDGLGHGLAAQKASLAARQYLEAHFDQSLPSLFRGVDRACRATRGVVMGLARFELARQTVTLASVGNVEIRILSGPAPVHCLARRGIVGYQTPEPLIIEHPWTASGLMVMHSDGLRSRWNWAEFVSTAREAPALIARKLLHELGTLEDDATVVVARSATLC